MTTPKTIVVPTDFSDVSKAAFAHARSLALAWDAEVVLVHVVPPEAYPTYRVVRSRGFPNLAEQMQKSALVQLEELGAELGKGVRFSCVCREGAVFRQVEEVAEERDADLIVIATHGRSGIKHALMGSIAERIVRSAPVPVLTVRAERERTPLSPTSIQRILVPTDFTDTSRWAFRLAQQFADADTEILVVHVFESPTYPNGPFGVLGVDMARVEVDLRNQAAQDMENLMAELRQGHENSRGLIIEGTPATELIELARKEDVDLIAISTHGHAGIKHMYLGSVAERVVRKAHCPVLTVREEVAAEDAAEA